LSAFFSWSIHSGGGGRSPVRINVLVLATVFNVHFIDACVVLMRFTA
jgi:hypothetical protein